MKSLLNNPYVNLLIRLILGIVLIVASLDKIANPNAFAISILNYKIISGSATLVIATFLPWMELICGLGLITGIALRGSALLSFLMLTVFTLAIISGLFRGLDISCGCFTQDPAVGKIGWMKVGENVLLVACSLSCYFAGSQRFMIKPFWMKMNTL